ncbi:MAG TPA: Xaa-Pro dipeptidase, partial [Gammaproteobacteria bacterium]|nr:Xaa-Pro dipeptidase [Gammaproteobacteria bacterium]
MSDALAKLYSAHLETVRRHFDAAMHAAGCDQVAVFAGSPHLLFLDDYHYPFKANPHFKYWVPLTEAPDSFVVYTAGKKPVLIYYQPDDYWHVPPAPPAGYWVEHFDVRVIKQPDTAREELPPAKKRAFLGEWRDDFRSWGFDLVNPEALINPLHYARAAKTAYELECMRRSNASAARGHRAAEQAFRAGASEYEIHNAFLAGAGETDDALPYHAIVALNEHAATLHYQHWERDRPKHHHAFLIDAGTQHHGYASDVTRTYSGEADEFQALVDGMDREQRALGAKVKPGLDFAQLHLEAHAAVARLLKEFGFADLSPEAMLAERVTSTFLPHGLGHLLGLQTHDVGGFMAGPAGGTLPKPEGHPYLRTTRTLGEGFVVTIEPGFYFIPALLDKLKAEPAGRHVDWKKVDAFRKFGGIRIEDNVVAKAAGPENMTRDAFKSAA